MGIHSPYVSTKPSPLPRSRGATPSLPLRKVDECSGEDFAEDCFELVPPALPLKDHLSGAPASPLWPKTPPSIAKLVEHNTFLEYVCDKSRDNSTNPSPLICSRQRALSDFTGMLLIKSGDIIKNIDDSLLPDADEPPDETCSETYAIEEDAPKSQQEWLQECYDYQDECYEQEMGYDYQDECYEQEMGWCQQEVHWQQHELQGYCYQDQWCNPDFQQGSVRCLPPPPPMPVGDSVYKPHWVYANTWPFNSAPTTLVLENLPRDLTQSNLIQVLDGEGFNGLYDFVFLPVSVRTGRSSRHAVVNFTRHSHGRLLAAHFHGRTEWGVCNESSCCKVKWSFPRQGLPELLEHYRNDVTMHESIPEHLHPALFSDGWQIQMPPPTRHIRLPQVRIEGSSDTRIHTPSVTTAQEDHQKTKHVLEFESTSEFPALGSSPSKKRNSP